MTLLYGLRINHHGGDHGRLLTEAVRPAIEALRRRHGPFAAAVRPHWSGGPHVLVAMEDDAPVAAGARWEALEADVGAWLQAQPTSEPIDEPGHRRRAALLAEVEGLEDYDEHIHPDRTVERGAFRFKAPLGKLELVPHRDAFKSATLHDVFDSVALRLSSPPAAMLDYARRLVCLEQVRWAEDLNFWPLSPRGQAIASVAASGDAQARFPAMAERLRPALRRMIEAEGLCSEDPRLSEDSRLWVAKAQRAYDALVDLTRRSPELRADQGTNIDAAREFSSKLPELSPQRVLDLLRSPIHFPYRVLMNFIYEMMPCIGFSPSKRIFACYLVTTTLEADFPHVLERAKKAGALI
ncbi:MAG: hypothetical protein JOZ90_11440 [Alphaproteobacteria bacterium]|nr:hypothetical protein [Alphaproteobacteria bacterium]MBV9372211.1 hypothetical protein [Alphaproteobacteria bacterium]MBV9901699.1 hypothetical protein [Alphaproteobacteria bacterium]